MWESRLVDPHLEKVISAEDFPHRFTLSAIWELPLGRGKPVFGGVTGLLSHIVSGWQLQAVYEGQSGDAVDFGNIIFTGNLHDVPLPVRARTPERWFNTAADFDSARATNSPVTSGRSRRGSTTFARTASTNFDASFFKVFRVNDRLAALAGDQGAVLIPMVSGPDVTMS
ncbi:MAG: hypothetical protein EHM23_31280 [Acidobacteria bacterium]|nr:MAG: hypothetical protein EHM23_31280 [Acidobacteriota bacterium]